MTENNLPERERAASEPLLAERKNSTSSNKNVRKSSVTSETKTKLATSPPLGTCQEVLTVTLFCFMNFLNFMNRYSTPPIVGRLKVAFKVDDTDLGLVQTLFELCYVVASPVFGYLGDRFQRRYLIAGSLLFSTASGVLSSFVPESSFTLLLITRALLGIAEASYTNICPSIIGDLFIGKKRTLVLTVYQFAIPLGCGVGYITAGTVADHLDDWRWSFRLTPIPMLLSALCLLIFVKEPARGQAENAVGAHETTSYKEDVKYLMKIPSFVTTTLAFVGVAFATGALCYWTPDLILRMLTMKGEREERAESETGFIFGLITIASGFFGVGVGVVISNLCLKPFVGLSADGIVCGASMLFAAPVIYFGLVVMKESMLAAWILIFFGIAALSSCLVLLSEITLNVVWPTRRATAESFQTTISHLLGDAAAPYLSGLMSDHLRWSHTSASNVKLHYHVADFSSMQASLFTSTFVIALSGGLFLMGSLYINEDAAEAKKLPLPLPPGSPEPTKRCYEQEVISTPV